MKNAKINKVVKWCLILAAVVMTGSFCFHSDIIYGEVKGDSIKNITGFMQDPKKNYNTKNQVKIGKVNITSFKNRYTTKAEKKNTQIIVKRRKWSQKSVQLLMIVLYMRMSI